MRLFLNYKYFYAINSPVILCEGKTDPIYIKCALRSLYKSYPNLVEKRKDGFKFKIKFLKYSKQIREVLNLSGGGAHFNEMINRYKKSFSNFHDGGAQYPVIILTDNDSGVNDIYKKVGAKKANRYANHHHLSENLYFAPIKLDKNKGEQEKFIEQLFPDEWLIKPLGTRYFSYDDNYNKDTHYGKLEFAEKVVLKNQKEINFQSFKIIFDQIEGVLNDHEKKLL